MKMATRYSTRFLYSLQAYAHPLTPAHKQHLKDHGILRLRTRPRGAKGGSNLQRNIKTIIGHRPTKIKTNHPCYQRHKTVSNHILKTIPLFDDTSSNPSPATPKVPRIYLSNPRSLINKLDEFHSTVLLNDADVAVVTETWFSEAHPLTALEVDGYNVFSKHRQERRGGGVAIFVRDSIQCRQLTEYTVPDEIECLWIQIRPHRLPRPLTAIALGGIYSPPNSPHQEILIEHLQSTADDICLKHPDCGLVLLGDFNRLNISDLCRGNGLTQVVKDNTRGDAILDMILTNMPDLYNRPTILPPIGSSDHNSILWCPKLNHIVHKVVKKKTRPLRESSLFAFGQWVTTHTWPEVYETKDVLSKADNFYSTLTSAADRFFPTKTVKVHPTDKIWMTPGVKHLIELRQKAFQNNRPAVWKFYRNKTQRAIVAAKRSHYSDRVASLKNTNPKRWHQEVMAMVNLRKVEGVISVPGVEPQDSETTANVINKSLAHISTALPSLNTEELPAFLPPTNPLPTIPVWEVYNALQAVKPTKAPGPDQIPQKLLKEFACEISAPLCHILNCSFNEGIVPKQWKEAVVIPIPKSRPAHIDQLRPISLTSQFAKIAEGFALKWILQDITFDSRQFGSIKGRSTTHALVSLMDSLYKNTEKAGSICSLVATDFSKAFDRVNHTIVIDKVLSMGLRPELVPWVCDFISQRRQRVRYHGALSEWESLTCGVAQGTLLGPVLFVALIDDAAQDSTSPVWKYIDDMNLLEARQQNQPSGLQRQLDQIAIWTARNDMLLNAKKCMVMHVTFSRNPLPPPSLSINNSSLQVAPKLKILGLIIQNDLRWNSQVEAMIKNANKKMFFLKSLRRFSVSTDDLLTIYTGYIRPILEYAAPAWNAGLTQALSSQLERVQKRACRIILSPKYEGYTAALLTLGITRLEIRREQICLTFAKTLQTSQFADWLPPTRLKISGRTTRNSHKLDTPFTRTKRYHNSPIPYLTNLMNKHMS